MSNAGQSQSQSSAQQSSSSVSSSSSSSSIAMLQQMFPGVKMSYGAPAQNGARS